VGSGAPGRPSGGRSGNGHGTTKMVFPMVNLGNTQREKRLFTKAALSLISQITLQLIRDGVIVPDGKTDEQIKTEVASFIKSEIAQKRFDISVGIDHTKQLLAEARKLLRQNKLEPAALYFATFFEHKLNWLIVQICHKKELEDATIKQVLRDAHVRAKCTWIMALLDHEPFSPRVVNTISEISEIRNSFIHYKWPSRNPDSKEYEKSKAKLSATMKKAEFVIRYFGRFEEKQLYKGQGKRVRSMLRTPAKSKGNTSNRNSAKSS
jgi:hypothetical protein